MIHALRYTEELEKVGFTTEQAKKSVQVWMELMDRNFATKADFKEQYFMTKADQMELRHEFKTQVDELRHDVNKLESKLTIKLGIMMAASIGIVSTIVALIK